MSLETQFVYLVHFHAIMFSYLCDKLMIARITQQPVSGWNNMLFLTLIGALNAYFGYKRLSNLILTIFRPFIPESLMLPALTYILIAIFIYFVVSVVCCFRLHIRVTFHSDHAIVTLSRHLCIQIGKAQTPQCKMKGKSNRRNLMPKLF